ncbi:hypothetical protein DM860_010828 [Cuscuta australis]|uniref:Uncharacterized protein n=1 Tax=Cuscuta australis TaxID=267555 RepID=A0A328E1M5_9ASTE|nr:hypothetical protein DM860_010828 [Cuscuta australis]
MTNKFLAIISLLALAILLRGAQPSSACRPLRHDAVSASAAKIGSSPPDPSLPPTNKDEEAIAGGGMVSSEAAASALRRKRVVSLLHMLPKGQVTPSGPGGITHDVSN